MCVKIPMMAILIRHLQTYGFGKSTKKGVKNLLKLLVFPFVLAIFVAFPLGFAFKTQIFNSLITIMAIFVPLLFTALISLHDTRQNLRARLDDDPGQFTKISYLLEKFEHLANNVSFILVVAICELMLLLVIIWVGDSAVSWFSQKTFLILRAATNSIVLYLLGVILIHLVHVIERLSALISVTPK